MGCQVFQAGSQGQAPQEGHAKEGQGGQRPSPGHFHPVFPVGSVVQETQMEKTQGEKNQGQKADFDRKMWPFKIRQIQTWNFSD